MDLGISGRVAAVTGASRGLGKQIASSLAEEGCKMAICARGMEVLQETTDELQSMGTDVLAVEADVSTPDGVQNFYDQIMERYGRVDIIVNNVGGTKGGRTFDETTDQDWLDTIELNLFSAVRLIRLGLPGMKERQWGRIVNVASIWGREFGGGLTYMTAKAALIAFSKHLALSMAQNNVLINTIAPGSIQFPGGGWDRFVKNNSEDVVQEFVARYLPSGKFGRPEPVGSMVAFLCSEKADLVTGASINVDGGQSRSLI